jgi:Flp pilus assembly protein TadD
MHLLCRRWLPLLALVVAALPAARADDTEAVRQLQAAGDYAAALEQTERILAARPKDAQMQFLRGVSLTELRRSDDAIAAFQAIIEAHPELAEPYNNLAALYAARGEYEKARVALEQALRSNPEYAVAHENLGDIHAALAVRSWTQSLKYAPENRGLATKLSIARELLRSPPSSP